VDANDQDRIASNEDVFRKINEGIERGQWPGEEDAPVAFRCECARLGCNELIDVSVRDYERVRSHPRRFIVAVGHDVPEVETVVEAPGKYVVIEKGDQAGRKAEANDPRR
jgi:hypothetical protein